MGQITEIHNLSKYRDEVTVGPATNGRSTVQPLYLRHKEDCRRQGTNFLRARQPECLLSDSVCRNNRAATPYCLTSQQYSCLNKTNKIITPIDRPV